MATVDLSKITFPIPIPDIRTKNLVGRRSHRLLILSYAGQYYRKGAQWLCLCDCGSVGVWCGSQLARGRVRSCGCWHDEERSALATRHGMSQSPEYKCYQQAKNRCSSPRNSRFERYGGRGIEFRFDSFNHFLEVVGERPREGMSLDRVDNDGHYEPGNVRWASAKAQARNRLGTVFLTAHGITATTYEWERISGTPAHRIRNRVVELGWCDSCAINNRKFQRCEHF